MVKICILRYLYNNGIDDAFVIGTKQDGGRKDVRNIFLFRVRINGVAPTKAQYEVQEKENAYTGQENTICIFFPESGGTFGCRCQCSNDGPADNDYSAAPIRLGTQQEPGIY